MSVVVEVSARKFIVPHECACCAASPEVHREASYTRRTGKRVIRETTRSLNFPYCARCDAHVEKWNAASVLLGVLLFASIVVAIIIGIGTGAGAGFGVFVGLVVLSFVAFSRAQSSARALCGPTCVTPAAAVEHLGWSGSVSSFRLESDVYAVKFAEANHKNLINVSMQLHRLLEQRLAAASVTALPMPDHKVLPTPRQAPQPASGSRDSVLEWIARIESFKGAEARRNALQRALSEVIEPQGRRELVLAASRIEVAAVLDKVDGLASAAAKKRHLLKAIADIRADNIPDELQTEELRQLEDRLRDLN